MYIIAILVILAFIFWLLGFKWEKSLKRPKLNTKQLPLVSILIPSYRSVETIEETLKSVKNLNYPRKEVIVINDSKDDVYSICKKYGVKFIQSSKRLGKATALNKAVKIAKGSVLFFLDADTSVSRDCLLKLVPWFSNSEIGAVAPRFLVKNKEKLLTKLISLENSFISSFFKAHMFFGSMLSFRGCAVAIKRNVFEKLNGWSKTLTEDIDFSAKLIKAGFKIQYEPNAIVETIEPETITELKKQRTRWGKGAMFSFFRHRDKYTFSPQFFLEIYIYILLAIAIIGILVFQLVIYLILLFSLYTIYAFSATQLLTFIALILVPLITSYFVSVSVGSILHAAILIYPESRVNNVKNIILIIPYIFFYLPVIMYAYFKGILSGIKAKKNNKSEINFKYW